MWSMTWQALSVRLYGLAVALAKSSTDSRYSNDEIVSHDGEAVQVELMKPKLTAPGTKALETKYDNPLSSFAFTFNLCLYMTGLPAAATRSPGWATSAASSARNSGMRWTSSRSTRPSSFPTWCRSVSRRRTCIARRQGLTTFCPLYS